MKRLFQYTLYNVGNVAAQDVGIMDDSFPTDAFITAGGQLSVKIDRIPPSTNVSHTVVVRPTKYGLFNFSAAIVQYKATENAEEVCTVVLLLMTHDESRVNKRYNFYSQISDSECYFE